MAKTTKKNNNNVTMNELNEMMLEMMNNMANIIHMYNDLQSQNTVHQTVASNNTVATSTATSTTTRVAAPKPTNTVDVATADTTANTNINTNTNTNKKMTRSEAIRAWKIEKYGSEEVANRVSAMTKVVANEWAAKARATGHFVIPRNKYKEELWKEAEKRVNAQIAKAASKGKTKKA